MSERDDEWRMREYRNWEKGKVSFDLTKEFRDNNQALLKNYGRDRYTYQPELYDKAHNYWYQNEQRIIHGYPVTAWMQLGFIYATGVYTAQEQGCVPRGTMFARFWRYHYFDWLTFLRRGSIYGIGGGLAVGTLLFGSPDMSLKRVISKYQYWFHEDKLDVRGDFGNLQIS